MSVEHSGADYLRRLKADQERPLASPSPAPAAAPVALAPVPDQQPSPAERRKSPRYKCEGSAEFRAEGSDVRTWGTLTDISVHGCYIEMTATFPVGAIVDLALTLNSLQARVTGEVRVSYPFLGIGVAFRDVSPESQRALVAMTQSLCTPLLVQKPPAAFGNAPLSNTPTPVIVSPVTALQALVDFFEAHATLTRDEFLQLIRASQTHSP